VSKLKNFVKNVGKAISGKKITADELYNYSDKSSRETTVPYLFEYAKSQRSDQDVKWRKYDDYYNNKHVTQAEIEQSCIDRGVPFIPAVIPDPYIHVESQIIPDVPDFEFNGRDSYLDQEKAKEREYVTKYVVENNRVDSMNTDNERRLRMLGNAFWKVSWNGGKRLKDADGKDVWGDIEVGAIDPACVFPDPSADCIDECEYIVYAYRMHKNKVARTFAKQMKRLGLTVKDLGNNSSYGDTEIYNSSIHDTEDDSIQVIEFWFKHNEDGSEKVTYNVDGKEVTNTIEYKAGDIGCSIQVNGIELQYIPRYWESIGEWCQKYPFVKYCTISIPNRFWDRSEIEPIIELVDAADRELATYLLNDTFTANDIILYEENSLGDNAEVTNTPGAIIPMKQGMINNMRRLGGLSNLNGGLQNTIVFLRDMIQQVVGNYDSAQGKEPVRVTTASGIAQLNERADARKNIKKVDRLIGFELLYEMIDLHALEFYDDDRLIYLGAKDKQTEPVIFRFNSSSHKDKDGYAPRVDVTITAGDGVTKSKAFTAAAVSDLAKMNITPANAEIVKEWVDLIGLPNRTKIAESIDKALNPVPTAPEAPTLIETMQGEPQQGNQKQLAIDDILDDLDEGEREFVKQLLDQMPYEQIKFIQQNPEELAPIIEQAGGQ
jgi:hypothetical protein